jgi:hypothetical protein
LSDVLNAKGGLAPDTEGKGVVHQEDGPEDESIQPPVILGNNGFIGRVL